MASIQNPAQTSAHPSGGERVQPGGPLSGEVKRGGDFTLDTSGVVEGAPYVEMPEGKRFLSVGWAILDAVTQGYIEALFASTADNHLGYPILQWPNGSRRTIGFSDLAPETLAAIIADCAAKIARGAVDPNDADDGRMYWQQRQTGQLRHVCDDPLTAHLGDDGKVYLRAA